MGLVSSAGLGLVALCEVVRCWFVGLYVGRWFG